MKNHNSDIDFIFDHEPKRTGEPNDIELEIVQYDFMDGKGSVLVTLEELAAREKLDSELLKDYYCHYSGNLPLAILAAINDMNSIRLYSFLTKLFIPTFVEDHILKDFISEVNQLLKSQNKIQRQIEAGTAFRNQMVIFPGQIDRLMFGRCVNQNVFISKEELAFLELLERISAMSQQQRHDLDDQDRELLGKFLDEESAEYVLSGECNLSLTPAAGKVLLELCGKKTTREQNRILFERLSAGQ